MTSTRVTDDGNQNVTHYGHWMPKEKKFNSRFEPKSQSQVSNHSWYSLATVVTCWIRSMAVACSNYDKGGWGIMQCNGMPSWNCTIISIHWINGTGQVVASHMTFPHAKLPHHGDPLMDRIIASLFLVIKLWICLYILLVYIDRQYVSYYI